MASIKSLDPSTVHRICSGQVIINLANAVKELIENSLDAGSKNIEVRLKNYGSESIEVIDDGPGIDEADFQTITLKHYTSKIQNYEDLEILETFGFRGEALSSLCALSNLSITTRHSNSITATRLEYDHNGVIKSKTKCARSVGTTVLLEKIFFLLPVRHKEFIKNLKKEFNKLMQIIQCYCLISEGIKLSCFHIINDKSTKLMSTHSKNNLKENIIEIFGLSTFNNLVKFELSEPDDEILIEYKLKAPKSSNTECENTRSSGCLDLENKPNSKENETNKTSSYSDLFKIDGYISSNTHSFGRSAPDRQYLYVNKRPCDHSRLTKLINEIFHQYNRTQYPMYVLNISLNSKNVDVNVTPDKLQMFIRDESALLATIKGSLLKIYNRSFKLLNVDNTSFQSQKSSKLLSSFLASSKSSPQNLLGQQKLSTLALDDEEKMVESDKNITKLDDSNIVKSNRKEIEEIFPKTNKRLNSDDDDSNESVIRVKKICFDNKSDNEIREDKRVREEENKCEDNDEKSNEYPKSKLPKFTFHSTTDTSKVNNEIRETNQNANKNTKPLFIFHTLSKSKESTEIGQKSSPDPSQITMNDRLNLFQTRIGSSGVQLETFKKPIDLNDSLAERIDLHMCNRASGILDTQTSPSKLSKSPILNKNNKFQDNLKILGVKPTNLDHDLTDYVNNKENDLDLTSLFSTEIDLEVGGDSNKTGLTTSLSKETIEIQFSQNSTQSINSQIEFSPCSIIESTQNLTQESYFTQDSIQPTDYASNRQVKILSLNVEDFFKQQRQMIETLKNSKPSADIIEKKDKDLIENLKFKTKNLESKDAENELDRCITKEDFLRMRICGQFNKGFIVTELDNDLFIVDQHAADEIYNFETLQKTSKIQKQKLLQPRYLELSPSAEETLIENLSLLEKSGYEMQVCSNRKVGNRIMLTCVPMSSQSNKILNLKDIDELLFILSESELNPGSISTSSSDKSNITELKASSLRSFFASKACRKSVMIGDSLNMNEMKRIVNHLNEIDKPWNCPHGRPTMRHLINLDLLKKAFNSINSQEND